MYQQIISIENLKKLCVGNTVLYGYTTNIDNLSRILSIPLAGTASNDVMKSWDIKNKPVSNMLYYNGVCNSRNFKGFILDMVLAGVKVLFVLNDIVDNPYKSFSVKYAGHTQFCGREITISELCFIARYWDFPEIKNNIIFIRHNLPSPLINITVAPWEDVRFPNWISYYNHNKDVKKRELRRQDFIKFLGNV